MNTMAMAYGDNIELPEAFSIHQRDLLTLLKALQWQGSIYELLTVLPTEQATLSLDELRDVLGRLGFMTRLRRGEAGLIPACDLPTLGILGQERYVVVQARGFDQLEFSSGGEPLELEQGQSLQWLEIQPKSKKPLPRGTWFAELARNYHGAFIAVLILSLANAVLGLALPLFTMSVYDFLIPSGSLTGLMAIGGGAIIALVWMVADNRLKARLLSDLAANLNYQLGRALFGKLMASPAEFLMQSTPFQNEARIRDVDRIRDFVGGSLAVSLLDAPFVIVAIIAIAYLSGWLVLVPLFGAVFYFLLSYYFDARQLHAASYAGKVSQRMQEQKRQAIDGLMVLRESTDHTDWLNNFANESIRSARANFSYRMVASSQQVVGKAANMLIGLATLMTGIYMVLSGVMSAGGLIAAMMLIWRVTGPLQMAFFSAARIRQLRQSINQINAIMDAPYEQPPEKYFAPLTGQKAKMAVERLVYRYSADRDAALNGVSFPLERGQLMAVVGPNGCGKSTLLACMAGLLRPQAGSIRLDDHDIRQFRNVDYRNRVAYLNLRMDFIEGSVADNLRAAAPLATEAEMWAALDAFAMADCLRNFHDGLDTLLMEAGEVQLERTQALGIKLARMHLRDPDLVLIDDLYDGSDHPVMLALRQLIETPPEGKTIVYATHHKELMLKADVAIIMDKGTVAQMAALNQDKNEDSGETLVSGESSV
ncbi:peptidase domain-containing ABC transporter [Pseudomaricurvus sp. HS19]|uniref:peptidase domain-containing ABC transporter n=1 Tax=Pseudomaricurvus sp. HS19 TaxID=2692626 RepID=UPI00136EC4FD|nr:ATP-binding cassette domain-containing protein [Pseudomaricurvus sp. HS19]MYM64757.1 ATP-binding cassette domain-containing protein [Pseudomaricurvus sp. HS19]